MGRQNVPQFGPPPAVGLGQLKRFQGFGASRVLCRGVAKLVKASDFDSDMRGFESFLPCQTHFTQSLIPPQRFQV